MGLFSYCVEGNSSQSNKNSLQEEIEQKGPRCLARSLIILTKGMVLIGGGTEWGPDCGASEREHTWGETERLWRKLTFQQWCWSKRTHGKGEQRKKRNNVNLKLPAKIILVDWILNFSKLFYKSFFYKTFWKISEKSLGYKTRQSS